MKLSKYLLPAFSQVKFVGKPSKATITINKSFTNLHGYDLFKIHASHLGDVLYILLIRRQT